MMDIDHYNGNNYLILIEDNYIGTNSTSIIDHLKVVFFKQAPLIKFLTDNDIAFCSKLLKDFFDK